MQLDEESSQKRLAMIGLKVFGGVCWMAAYREAITESRHSGESLLPTKAIAFNLVWEAIYSAGGIVTWKKLTPEDRAQTIINTIWLLLDLEWSRSLKRQGIETPKGAITMAIVYHAAFLMIYPPGKAARISALWQNLAFSSYCALTNLHSGSSHNRRFTLLRAAGTAVPTFTSGVLRGMQPKYLLPGLGCIAFDIIRSIRSRGCP